MNWSVNNFYECENKDQLIKYYHASLCSYPKRTLVAAAKAGYLKGFPRLDATAINRHIGVEDTTEMGHMRQIPSGTRSTTKTSKRGRTAQAIHILERDAASDDAITTPTQEPSNEKTRKVYMSVNLADGWIASDQTGTFPRVSARGNKYICVFYIHDPNFIKGIAIKSRHRSELLGAYEKYTSVASPADSSLLYTGWITKRRRTSRNSLRASKQKYNTQPRVIIALPRRERCLLLSLVSSPPSHPCYLVS